ncbi:MAG: CHAT domain-containing protein, partial [bacterium]|nr:CHAT domain-containing protein [bacterium]
MVYEDFELLAYGVRDTKRKGKHRITFQLKVLRSPAGDTEERISSGYNVNEMRKKLELLQSVDWEAAIRLGQWLATLLLPPPVLKLLLSSINAVKSKEKGLRIRLRPEGLLGNIPWEYTLLNRGGGEAVSSDFLALMPDISIVRQQAATLPVGEVKAGDTARMVVASANPADYKQLNLDEEDASLRTLLSNNKRIEATFIMNATPETLAEALENVHLFHFSGHGEFEVLDPDDWGGVSGKGLIVLEDGNNKSVAVSAEQLAIQLRHAGVRVAVLNACKSGRRDDYNVWSSVSAALLKAEVGAVVGMQSPVSDKSALAFNSAFYMTLISGRSIDEAVAKGRLAASGKNPCDWAVPVLYLRNSDGVIFPELPTAANGGKEGTQIAANDGQPLESKISNHGFEPLERYKGDDSSSLGLEAPAVEETGIDVEFGNLLIERRLQKEILNDVDRFGDRVRWFNITGESGTGKSCLLRFLGESIGTEWFVRAHSLLEAETSLRRRQSQGRELFKKNAHSFLEDFEAKQTNDGNRNNCFILIDTLDLIVDEVGEDILREFLVRLLSLPGVILITTCRPIEFKALAKPLKLYKEQDDEFSKGKKKHRTYYRKYRLDDFDDNELSLVIERYIEAFYNSWGAGERNALLERLGSLRTEKREINHICRHPLSLRLLFEVYAGEVIPENITLRELYSLFWDKKVRGGHRETVRYRESYTMHAALEMFELGSDRTNEESVSRIFNKKCTVRDITGIRRALRSENIFKHKNKHESPDWLGAGSQTRELEFFHQSFQEYATARTLLESGYDFIKVLLAYVKRVPNDSMRLEVIRQVAYLDQLSLREILPDLLDAESVFLKKIAIDIYIKLEASAAANFRHQIEKLLSRALNTHKTNPNVLLLHFLDNVHNTSEHRYMELFDLETGFLKKLLVNTDYSRIIEHLFDAVSRIMLFQSGIAADWLKWSVHEWGPPPGRTDTFFPRCIIAPLLNWARWDEAASMPSLWYVFTDLARDRSKISILNGWPRLSLKMRIHYRDLLLEFLETHADDLKNNLQLTDAIASAVVKLFRDSDEHKILLERLTRVITNESARYPRAIAAALTAQLLPAGEREKWSKKILTPGIFSETLRMFLLGNLMRRWLEMGDEIVANLLWDAFCKEDASSELFIRLLELWSRYNGEAPDSNYPAGVYDLAFGKEEVSTRHKQYALFIISKTLSADTPENLRIFFDAMEELPRKIWKKMPQMLPAFGSFQPIIIEKIQVYAARKEAHIKQVALRLILAHSGDDDMFIQKITGAFENITDTSDAEVLELTVKELLGKPSLIKRLPSSYLRRLGWSCFLRNGHYLKALGLGLLAYGVPGKRWTLNETEWRQIWQAIERIQNPLVSRRLWELVQVAFAVEARETPTIWSWDIAGSFLDRWLEDDDMQKPVMECLLAVGELGTVNPEAAVSLLLQYTNRQMKDNGRYKWVGAMLRVFNSETVPLQTKQATISRILTLLMELNPDGQILLSDVILRLPEHFLSRCKGSNTFSDLLAEPRLCDRAKVIIQGHVGRHLDVPPLPRSLLRDIRESIFPF